MQSSATGELPKVSVLMVTYNHERFIQQTVDSALCQMTTFPFEIVIGEDCSTDRTRDILLDIQKAHPTKIRLLLREKNLGPQANFASTLAACQGKFVAMLEGDDYWTDPAKLQKQVDALESHPAWSMCFHLTRRVYEDGSREPQLYPPEWTRDEATIEDLFQGNFMNTCSIVFRNRLFGLLPDWHSQIVPGDWAISILNADLGPIGFVPGVMADYRIHPQGSWAQQSRSYQLKEILRLLSRIDHHFQGKYREPIDMYRIRLAEGLVSEIEWLQQQVSDLTTAATRSFSEIVATAETEVPAVQPRSPALQLVRMCMSPIENAVRRGRKAMSLFILSASERWKLPDC